MRGRLATREQPSASPPAHVLPAGGQVQLLGYQRAAAQLGAGGTPEQAEATRVTSTGAARATVLRGPQVLGEQVRRRAQVGEVEDREQAGFSGLRFLERGGVADSDPHPVRREKEVRVAAPPGARVAL